MRSMIETYPEADRYWVVHRIGSAYRGRRPADAGADPRLRRLRARCSRRSLRRPWTPTWPTSPRPRKLMSRIKARYPAAKLGAELIFRGGQLRALDAVLPKDVWLMNMVNWDGETAMSDFDKIQGRELVVWPRITDDGGELNIQLNAMMYDQEETISGSVRYGVTGVLGQLNKARGAEAERSVHRRRRLEPAHPLPVVLRSATCGRLFGPDALDTLLKAYLLLEENEKTLGWHGRRGLFGTYHHGNRMGVALRNVDYQTGAADTRPPAGGEGHPGRRTKSGSSGTVARPTAARPWSCCGRRVPRSCPARARNWST